jgi:hypothetical protein
MLLFNLLILRIGLPRLATVMIRVMGQIIIFSPNIVMAVV